MLYSLVDKNDEGYSFVNGNTKYLTKMNQKDLKVLFDNGDPRVKAEPSEKSEVPAKKTESSKPALPEAGK